MRLQLHRAIVLIALGHVIMLAAPSRAGILTPAIFNIATNKHVTATATCGEGVNEPELYCKLTGSTADRETSNKANLIQVVDDSH